MEKIFNIQKFFKYLSGTAFKTITSQDILAN